MKGYSDKSILLNMDIKILIKLITNININFQILK